MRAASSTWIKRWNLVSPDREDQPAVNRSRMGADRTRPGMPALLRRPEPRFSELDLLE
jgi:hypothetical protein